MPHGSGVGRVHDAAYEERNKVRTQLMRDIAKSFSVTLNGLSYPAYKTANPMSLHTATMTAFYEAGMHAKGLKP